MTTILEDIRSAAETIELKFTPVIQKVRARLPRVAARIHVGRTDRFQTGPASAWVDFSAPQRENPNEKAFFRVFDSDLENEKAFDSNLEHFLDLVRP